MKQVKFMGALLTAALFGLLAIACGAAPPLEKMDVDKIMPPLLQSAVIESANPSSIVLTFNNDMLIDGYDAWHVRVMGTGSIDFDTQRFPDGYGTKVITMHLNRSVTAGESVILEYGGMSASPQGQAMSADSQPLIAFYYFHVNNKIGSLYTITFNANGGQNPPAQMTVSQGSSVTLPGRSGMTYSDSQTAFAGWATSQTGARFTNDKGYVENGYKPTGSVTLWAVWMNVEDLLREVEQNIAKMDYQIGNANSNKDLAWELAVLISVLQRTQGGDDITVGMVTPGGKVDVVVPQYNSSEVSDWAKVLQDFVSNPNIDFSKFKILVQEMRFFYVMPTEDRRDPVQNVKIGQDGKYQIELRGAAGGHMWTRTNSTAPGGKGGYVKADFQISGGTELDIRVGGMGYGSSTYDPTAPANNAFKTTNYSLAVNRTAYPVTGGTITMTSYDSKHAGGYNGGGTGGAVGNAGFRGGAGGGGATDVRVKGGASLTGSASTDSRFIVAGGGGGTAQQNGQAGNNWKALAGGNGGGTVGAVGGVDNPDKYAPRGGTQTSGGAAVYITYNGTQYIQCVPGTAGKGSDGSPGYNDDRRHEGRGGGGGGWWGGSAQSNAYPVSSNVADSFVASGAGGSSYIMDVNSSKNGITRIQGADENKTYALNVYDHGWARVAYIGE